MTAAVLPKQVQAQLEEAERIQQALAQQPTEPVDPAPAANAEPPPPEPQAVEPEPPQPAPAPAEPAPDAVYWQNRFKTLEGIHKAEAHRMSEQLRVQGEQMRLLATQLERLNSQPPQPKVPEQPLVTSQDDDKFGSDMIDVMRRVVREESRNLDKRLQTAEDYVRKLTPQMERVRQVEQEVTQTREERFWSELQMAVPEWEVINGDQKFHAWLSEYDPVAGRTRQESLNEAQSRFDSRRVVAMFKLYRDGSGKAPAAPGKQQPELVRQVAPSKTSTVAVPPQQEKTYTGADYVYWLDPRRANDTAPEKVAAMKAEVERAYAEGRIKW